MYNKKIKILVGLVALIVILFIGTKSNADFDLTYEDVEATEAFYNGDWHYKPNNLKDNSMFFCIELGASYKKAYASLTNSDKGSHTWRDDGYGTGWEDHGDNVYSDTTQAVGSANTKKSMHYSRGNSITAQDFAYALTTAKAKGYGIMTTEMQRTIWGTTANKSDKTDETALSKEATSYLNFYNAKEEQKKLTPENPINLKDKTEYSSKDGNQKPTVAMDSSSGTYTVGAFKFTHIKGDYTKDGKTDTSTGEYATPEEYVDKYKEKLEEMMNNAKIIYDDLKKSIKEEKDKDDKPIQNYNGIRYNSVEAAANFITVYDGTKSYLNNDKNFNKNDTSNTIQEIKNKIANIQNAVKQLEFKKGKSDENIKEAINRIKKYADDIDMVAASENSQTKFSYVKSISLIGVDADGNERVLATNDTKDDTQMKVLDANGNKIQHKILENNNAEQTGILSEKAYNIPQSGDVFYVQFKLNEKDKDIKKIKVKVGARYLDSCNVTAYEYQGTVYNWQWVDESTGSECCPPDIHEPHSWPPDKNGNGGGSCSGWITRYYYHQAVLHIRATGTKTQWLVGIPEDEFKNNAHKEWKLQELTMGGDGIDITMKLGGYVFLDQDQGKVNEGNNILDKDEGLSTADVWLYEYTGNNKEGTLVDVTLTDKNGYYEFRDLDITKKYYVKFTYNGMLYTNVEYKIDDWYGSENWQKTSKAKEVGRQEFNNKFGEIGSYPSNYKIKDKMFGNELGDYNRVFLQEEIVNIYKELSEQIVLTKGNIQQACVNVANAHQDEQQIKEKVQFAHDCRMIATTDREKVHINGGDAGTYYIYPVYEKFTTTSYQVVNVAGKTYNPIYTGQMYINYGIKARSTVDLALYKDVEKAEVSINGKTETYTYDLLNSIDANGNVKGFSIGVNESDYLNGLRGAYKDGKAYKNDTVTRAIETDAYTANMRKEEVTNAGSFDVKDTTVTKYDLKDSDRLNIEVVYKISIINQSSTTSAVTEVVDYYDNNFEFVSAYVGDKDGKQLGTAKKYDNSMYANSEYKSTKNAYKTIYIRPDAETRLNNNEQQFIYVRLRLVGQNRAGELLSSVLKSETDKLTVLNLAEINGYKTYYAKDNNGTPGLIDIDSNPGNLNISNINGLTQENIVSYPNIRAMYEDDTRRAPAIVYGLYEERTLSGTVFEDNTGWNDETIHTGDTRKGNGQLDDKDAGIQGVQVELVEMKNNQLIIRASTFTDQNGNYKFSGFVPGNYTIRYTYGKNQETALSKNSKWYKGVNEKSYNGQDFQSTIFTNKTAYYWYTADNKLSDAVDDETRKNQVIAYSDTKIDGESADYNVAITNHKAEVFKSYEAEQPEHITKEYNASLVNELASKTYRYAYTPEIAVEVEYATQTIAGTQNSDKYAHNITGVDFGIVERPRSELVIDQDVARVKVTAADGITVLFDSDGSKNVSNLNWTKGMQNTSRYHGTKIEGTNKTKYTNGELVNVIMDEELMSGAKIEITYKFTVTNNGEADGNSTTAAKTIVNYVANNLDFDASANKDWTVVKVEDIQNDKNSTFVNNTLGNNNLKLLDLSTQSTILKTTSNNALTKALAPGEQATATLTLSKVMSTESAIDMLSYSNIAEIVEIANTVGRYDRGATPGNQDVAELPEEHDTTGVVNGLTSDATVIVTPPTGSQYIYYIIGIASAAILAGGIILIKKFVIDKNK